MSNPFALLCTDCDDGTPSSNIADTQSDAPSGEMGVSDDGRSDATRWADLSDDEEEARRLENAEFSKKMENPLTTRRQAADIVAKGNNKLWKIMCEGAHGEDGPILDTKVWASTCGAYHDAEDAKTAEDGFKVQSVKGKQRNMMPRDKAVEFATAEYWRVVNERTMEAGRKLCFYQDLLAGKD